MSDTSSVSSSAGAFVGRQIDNLNKARVATTTTFTGLLNQAEVAVGLKPKTGFTAGATYDTQTLAGQTKATFKHALDSTKAALHIK